MRQGSTGRRSRGRPNRKQHGGSPRSGNYDSSGPEGRIRGNAHQIYERYVGMARDALSSGDRITAETYFQHAEHYFRIMNARNEGAPNQQNAARHRGNGHAAEWATGESPDDDDEESGSQQPQDRKPQDRSPAGAQNATPPAPPEAKAAEAGAAQADAAQAGATQADAASGGRRAPRGQPRRRGGRARGEDPSDSADGSGGGGDEVAES